MSVSVGIDIGYETVKLVGLEKGRQKWRLQGMAIASIPLNSWQPDGLQHYEEIAKVIQSALKNAKPSAIVAKAAMIALPESVIFSGTFAVPSLSAKEIAQAVPFELADKLSINLEEYDYDYEMLNSRCRPIDQPVAKAAKSTEKPDKMAAAQPATPAETPSNQLAVFAVAAKKTLIQSVVALAQAAKLELVGIHIKPGAIARAVLAAEDEKARVIVDLGVGSTGASIVEGRNIRVTSTVPRGVKALLGHASPPEILQQEFGPIFDELVHITKFFENRVCPGVKVEEIILSGSGCYVPGVAEAFQKETGLPTVLGQPFNAIDTDHYPVPEEYAHTFSDAIGLAMSDPRQKRGWKKQ